MTHWLFSSRGSHLVLCAGGALVAAGVVAAAVARRVAAGTRNLDGQLRQPSGLLGAWLMPRVFTKLNGQTVLTAVEQVVQPEPHHDVLEVGFGSGDALQHVLRLVPARRVYGLDFSEAMVRHTSARFAALVDSGRLVLLRGSVESAFGLPFGAQAFDRIFAVNCVYFWQDLQRAAANLLRSLKPGGRLCLVTKFHRIQAADPAVFIVRDAGVVVAALQAAGFRDVAVEDHACDDALHSFQAIVGSA